MITMNSILLGVRAGLVPAIPLRDAQCSPRRDHRDIGERSDAVLRTTMPGDDGLMLGKLIP
jgi:hypothetical protein